MARYIISYDVRATNHNYEALYELLNGWGAAHLQNSVWLAELNGTASDVRDTIKTYVHQNDTICVIQLPDGHAGWATQRSRVTGNQWLKARWP